MTDNILADWLTAAEPEISELCNASSRLEYRAIPLDDGLPPRIFLIGMHCAQMVHTSGEVERVDGRAVISVQIPTDYLRRPFPYPGQVLSLAEPLNCWHPNVRGPAICAGPIAPGTSIVELVMRCYELLTFNNFTPREDDCLNLMACRWARAHMSDFPLESRPLRDLAVDHQSESTVDDFTLEAPER